jgi:quercetin dioxygenase-like cupin family protein
MKKTQETKAGKRGPSTGEIESRNRCIRHWSEQPPEEFPPDSAFRDLDIRFLITSDTVPKNNKTVFGRAIFPKGAIHGKHMHHGAEEIVYIVKGTGTAFYEGKTYEMKAGTVQFVPQGEVHGLKNEYDEPLEIIWGYFGAASLEATQYEEFPPDQLGF